MSTPLLYTAELDLAEEDVAAFNAWYAGRHAPDVYQCGFLTCACYRAIEGTSAGEMNLFDIYEIPGSEVFGTQRYLGMRGRDPYMAALMEKRRNKAHTVYEQRLIAPDTPGAWLNGDYLSVVRFAAPPHLDDALASFLRAEAAGLGAIRLRYAVRGVDHPRNPTFRPRCMVVAEWADRPPVAADLTGALSRRFGGAIAEASVFVGARIYPWPDRG